MVTPPLARRLVAEFVGTALLVTIVVGSGIAASQLSPRDVGLQLLENSTATALGLAVLILALGPVSGAHFNPLVSVADAVLGRRNPSALGAGECFAYAAVQVIGAIAGCWLADAMFGVPLVDASAHHRASAGHLLGEVVATAGLIAVISALSRTARGAVAGPAVGAYIGAAYWFTSSTSFANPAVTIGRAFTDSFAGIAPTSVPAFVGAQVVGAVVGGALIAFLYPDVGDSAGAVVVPHAVAKEQ